MIDLLNLPSSYRSPHKNYTRLLQFWFSWHGPSFDKIVNWFRNLRFYASLSPRFHPRYRARVRWKAVLHPPGRLWANIPSWLTPISHSRISPGRVPLSFVLVNRTLACQVPYPAPIRVSITCLSSGNQTLVSIRPQNQSPTSSAWARKLTGVNAREAGRKL